MTSTTSALRVRPRLQIALDTFSLPAALGPLQKAAPHVDVIEVGTVLCLSEGMHAVRAIRALFPEKPVLADVRIAEAGNIIATMAYEAGASWVSVVAGASLTTVQQVCAVATRFGGEVQIELGDTYDADAARAWRAAGAQHVIVHRSRDAEATGELTWGPDDLDRVDELDDMGFTVTITGGVTAQDLLAFAGRPVGIIIAGRAVVNAEDPAAAAQGLQDTIGQIWS